MSEPDKRSRQDYSEFDAMSTEALREILRLDSYLPEDQPSDMDAILYIMEVLAKREEEENGAADCDVEAAWQEFNRYYRPFTDDPTSLYDESGFTEDPLPEEADKDVEENPSIPEIRPTRKKSRFKFRAGVAALIAVALLVASSASASAFGYDVWSAFTKWTGEVFGFQMGKEQENPSTAKQLKTLEHDMKARGVTAKVLPTYLPEGYEVVNTQSQVQEDYIKFDCLLLSDEGSIVLSYWAYTSEKFSSEFEKNISEPEVYDSNGNTFYIMVNETDYFAAWMIDNVQCQIYGVASREELIKIIDSIK